MPDRKGERALDEMARSELLAIARQTVTATVTGQPWPPFQARHPELQEPRGVFVTLRTEGRLRGCIGCFEASQPLHEVVAEMAESSALRDPRFILDRLRPEELEELTIEISVLSPLQKIDDPLDFELGRHGIYLKRGVASGCFLPQVAEETGWSKEEFLTQCASGKAGLPADTWKDPATEVFRFTCEIIQEE